MHLVFSAILSRPSFFLAPIKDSFFLCSIYINFCGDLHLQNKPEADVVLLNLPKK
jgi:hypothetical protein